MAGDACFENWRVWLCIKGRADCVDEEIKVAHLMTIVGHCDIDGDFDGACPTNHRQTATVPLQK